MREYLFRGKRTDNGEWVYGHHVHYDDIKDNGKDDCDYIVEKHNGEYFPFREVDPETVGEYIGLTDVDGTKIFEGSILQSENYEDGDEVGAVVWNDYDCAYWVHSEKYGWWMGLHDPVNGWKVIGNIHDNPELLNGEG